MTSDSDYTGIARHRSSQASIPPDLLNSLPARDREILEAVLKQHRKLTPKEALAALREAGL